MCHFISLEGLYHQPGHIIEYVDLCDWADTGQDKMCIVPFRALPQELDV
jgi:hypothetical protein